MKYLNGTLIVEGSNDASYLSSFIKGEIVVLNGYELSNLQYLKELEKRNKKIILLTDPDEAGLKIRKLIEKEIPTCISVNVDINKCTRNIKTGIAECEKNEILKCLENHLSNEPIYKSGNILVSDLYKINKNDDLVNKYNLGKCNTKKIAERLNSLGITKEEIYGN